MGEPKKEKKNSKLKEQHAQWHDGACHVLGARHRVILKHKVSGRLVNNKVEKMMKDWSKSSDTTTKGLDHVTR